MKLIIVFLSLKSVCFSISNSKQLFVLYYVYEEARRLWYISSCNSGYFLLIIYRKISDSCWGGLLLLLSFRKEIIPLPFTALRFLHIIFRDIWSILFPICWVPRFVSLRYAQFFINIFIKIDFHPSNIVTSTLFRTSNNCIFLFFFHANHAY